MLFLLRFLSFLQPRYLKIILVLVKLIVKIEFFQNNLENKIILLTPLADYFTCSKQKLT